jgi:hypothetical protein
MGGLDFGNLSMDLYSVHNSVCRWLVRDNTSNSSSLFRNSCLLFLVSVFKAEATKDTIEESRGS